MRARARIRRQHPLLPAALEGRTLRPLRNLTRPSLGDQVTAGSSDRFLWECLSCHHEWETKASKVAAEGSGCPRCAGRIHESLASAIASTTLEIVKNLTNPHQSISEVSCRSRNICLWKCRACGHQWQTRVSRAIDDGCPLCARRSTLPAEPVAALRPDLVPEFVDNLTSGRSLTQLTRGSRDRCQWECSTCGHRWIATVATRATAGSGCQKCGRIKTGEKLMKPLGATFPRLALEFQRNLTRPDRTADTTPSAGTDRVEWRCTFGHVWQTTVCQRSKQKTGCPTCKAMTRRSRFELEVGHLLSAATGLTVSYDFLVQCSVNGRTRNYRVDLHLPEVGILIDLDPFSWHKSADNVLRDQRKADRLTSRHYIRVRPRILASLRATTVTVDDRGTDPILWLDAVCSYLKQHNVSARQLNDKQIKECLTAAAREWINLVGTPPSPSLASAFPDISREFVSNCNRPGITPELMHPGSNDRCKWKCSRCGHEWATNVNSRTADSSKCPLCARITAGRLRALAIAGKSLAELRLDVAQCFLENLSNPDAGPDRLYVSSGDRCLWLCPGCSNTRICRVADAVKAIACVKCGYERIGAARILDASTRGRVLSVTHPELAAQVDVDGTGRTPEEIPTAGRAAIWWKCPAGDDHRWSAPPYSRTSPSCPTGCPFCSGRRPSSTTQLDVTHPELAAQLDLTKTTISAAQLTAGSNKIVPWFCPTAPDHRWTGSPASRINKGRVAGCPFCAGKRLSASNRLTTRAPEVAVYLDAEQSGKTADQLYFRSRFKAVWTCTANPEHSYALPVRDRLVTTGRCPQCRN
ncbi:zinc-ribbon domain-containing protein [Amycolatopsis sp. NPDC006125]|uniref:zinc-ribbon domain-containing protein n=1 Tax=Amycolatopsis sp. NPDC006125 TaxID=3156730 RepID=UPI0033A3A6A3